MLAHAEATSGWLIYLATVTTLLLHNTTKHNKTTLHEKPTLQKPLPPTTVESHSHTPPPRTTTTLRSTCSNSNAYPLMLFATQVELKLYPQCGDK